MLISGLGCQASTWAWGCGLWDCPRAIPSTSSPTCSPIPTPSRPTPPPWDTPRRVWSRLCFVAKCKGEWCRDGHGDAAANAQGRGALGPSESPHGRPHETGAPPDAATAPPHAAAASPWSPTSSPSPSSSSLPSPLAQGWSTTWEPRPPPPGPPLGASGRAAGPGPGAGGRRRRRRRSRRPASPSPCHRDRLPKASTSPCRASPPTKDGSVRRTPYEIPLGFRLPL